jgi:hypothetical protein
MKKGLIKTSIICNILITVLMISAVIIMFTGFKFMEGDLVLDVSGFGMLQFFTVQSNIFMGIVALVFAIEEIRLLKGKIKEIPLRFYILKLMGTVGVTVTLLTVFIYLGPFSKGGIGMFLKNANLFLHLIIPVLSIISFIFLDRTKQMKFKYALAGTTPVVLYAIYYLTNILIHIENGAVSTKYDWYWFVQGGLNQAFYVLPIMILGTYVVSILLWLCNHKRR